MSKNSFKLTQAKNLIYSHNENSAITCILKDYQAAIISDSSRKKQKFYLKANKTKLRVSGSLKILKKSKDSILLRSHCRVPRLILLKKDGSIKHITVNEAIFKGKSVTYALRKNGEIFKIKDTIKKIFNCKKLVDKHIEIVGPEFNAVYAREAEEIDEDTLVISSLSSGKFSIYSFEDSYEFVLLKLESSKIYIRSVKKIQKRYLLFILKSSNSNLDKNYE